MHANNQRQVVSLRPLTPWLDAMRPRTLPLALSSVVVGSCLAAAQGRCEWTVIVLTLLTSVSLQVLSNLANDYGDGVKGSDNEQRVGPRRAVQSRAIRPADMKSAVIVFAALSVLLGIALLVVAFGDTPRPLSLTFLAVGVAAVASAILYSNGSTPYGYKGLGDLFVFLFFGLIGVAGSCFLNTLHWRWDDLLPAAAVGFLSVGVLNVNNMRDMDSDLATGKTTTAALLRYGGARVYHALLILGAFVAAVLFLQIRVHRVWSYLFLLSLPFFVRDVVSIFKTADYRKLDPFLKRLTLTSLLFSALFGVGVLL